MLLARCFTLLLLLVLGGSPLLAQSGNVSYQTLETIVQAEMKSANVPGAVVVVVRGNRIDYAKGFGVASVETKEAVTPDHLFRIGSTTKMFVGLAALRLAEQDKLKLHDPVSRQIDGLPAALGAVTLHQLLTHTAGLADEAPMFGRHDEEALGAGIRTWSETRLFAKPGDVYSYSNPGYWLAGYTLERAAKKPFADVLNDELFQPLGMTRTTFKPMHAMTYPLAQGHEPHSGSVSVIRPAANNAATWPAGSMYSSGHDLARFVIAFLNDGQIDGKTVLSCDTLNSMVSPQVKLPGDRGHYSYGLALTTLRGVPTQSHGGSRSGYGSHLAMSMKHRTGIIVLANRSGAGMPKTVAAAAELLLPLAPVEKAEPAAKPNADEQKSWLGIYRNGSSSVELIWHENA
jgi:CubicO group peptidase (beta-lactamase class C family)